ncbi:MAG: helix-turn-helix transcriptional regulator [Fibrobacter sp.]|nr:helix-turn-helix transcriptional regulator [Fibrobacter sp.]
MQNFRENVLYVLKARGLTQTEVAKRLDVTKQSIQHYLSGRITVPTLYALADALDTTPATLLSEVPLSMTGEAIPGRQKASATTLTCPCCGAELKLMARADLKRESEK